MRLSSLLLTSLVAVSTFPPVAFADGDPNIKWQWRVEPQAAKAGDEVQLVFNAEIPDGFILYSSDFQAELGPRPAKFSFDSNDAIELTAPIEAVKSQRRKDKTFGTEYTYFAGRAEFRQKARLLKNSVSVKARIDGQTCQEKDGLCALFNETFSINLR